MSASSSTVRVCLISSDLDSQCLIFAISAFDRRSKTAREVLRQVRASRFKNANPKLSIDVDTHGRADKPALSFAFVDGTEVCLTV